ncbi:MAG: DoxX family protein [Planctomycetota bacterium]
MKGSSQKFLEFGLLWLRVLMGLGIAIHGYNKIFVYGIGKFEESVRQLGFPLPLFFAWAGALSEFVGGILLVLGLGTRIAASFIFITMTVAAFVAHKSDPFSKKELALAYWVIASSLIFTGPGSFSLDRLIFHPKSNRSPQTNLR